MSSIRDLAWKRLDLLHRSSVAYSFARYALSLNYVSLPANVVHQAKRCLLDALGCAIGAYDAPGRSICEASINELGGSEEATIFGSGFRTSALNATLVNSFLVRYLDYNDLGGGGHNSDSIPSILAVAEREEVGGSDFLTSLVISYELGARVSESIAGKTEAEITGCQWTDIRAALNMPPALGRLMGLNEDQIANAIGICASYCLPLGILDAHKEEFCMNKNLRFGLVAYNAILACILAKKGFTGPARIVEGEGGLREVALRGDMDLERVVDFSGWRILKTKFKVLCANITTIGHVLATLAIVKEHDLKPEDVAAVRIGACLRETLHTTASARKYPRNGENADHSAFYANAIAIKDRAFGPESFRPEKLADPIVLDLIEKITVEYDPSLPRYGYQGMSEITTNDGRRFQKRIDNPHGLGDDPLTDQELEGKFRETASTYMPENQISKIIDLVWNLEKVDNLDRLTKLMIFPE